MRYLKFYTLYSISRQRGQVVLAAAVFFLVAFLLIVTGIAIPIYADVASSREAMKSLQSYALSEGLIEDITYRIKNGLPISATEALVDGASKADAIVTIPLPDEREVVSLGDTADSVRKIKVRLTVGSGASFNFGVQAGDGGVIMNNSSSIQGNLYSNGTVVGTSLNIIQGDVISAGPAGLIDGIRSINSSYANNIQSSYVEGNAYYQTIDLATTVVGTKYSGSPDQPTSAMPITDAQVTQWEADAEAGGVISSPCPYVVNSDTPLGPVKILCDLEIENNPVVTLQGTVWVVGDIIIKKFPKIKVDPALGNLSVVMIADDPLNRLTKSKISFEQRPEFFGSGAGNSYVLMLSQNQSAETGGAVTAIEVRQGAEGDILVYAGHGKILIQQSATLKEVTGWKVHLQNSSEVIYETGLASLLFTSGPGGGFVISQWVEEP